MEATLAKTFIGWLRKQTKRKDPVGVLAKALADDSSFPAKVTSTKGLKIYLNELGGDPTLLSALDAAADEYRTLKDAS